MELRSAPIFVNNEEISEDAISREAQHHPAASPAESRAAAARALVVRALLLQRAREVGLSAEAHADSDGRVETQEEALIRQALECEAEVAIPGDAECRRYYDAHQKEFTAPELFEASHILYDPGSNLPDAEEAARGRAAATIARLARSPHEFAELARLESACPSGAHGGALGQLQSGDLASEFEEALALMEPGQVGLTPVQTRFGWHVIRLDRRIEPRVVPFEAALPRIRERLGARAWATGAARYVSRLARAAKIEGLDLEPGWT
jgi:peptidyl-prolyl cis-trans isomerase C